jgi:outer membrane protein OmpA-like peptidoglycan-associated protein
MTRKVLFFTYIFINFFVTAQSQQKSDSIEIAEAFIENENFTQAIGFYKRFLQQDPENPTLNFKMGFCLLNTPDGKEASIPYLQKSTDILLRKKGNKNPDYIESDFYLSRAYRASYQFDKSKEMFDELRANVKNKTLLAEIDKELILCDVGKKYYNNPVQLSITNLGEEINTRFSEHSPVVSADESVLIFTSRRPLNNGVEPDGDGQYDENIFISEKVNGKWSEPKSISDSINTPEHEASIGLSVDGQILFIYREDDDGSIYESRLIGQKWSVPEKLGPNINTKYRETDASLSADGRFLYFTSDRPGGFGGLDIYVSELQKDGTWGVAKNLGTTINTEADEESPYIHPDGITLYFSSKGHERIGGYDIFKSEKNDFGTWTEPENMGYPINTVDDDVFFIPTADGKRAYFASLREGSYGNTDIYEMDMLNAKGNKVTVLIGKVFVCEGSLPKTEITITDKQTGNEGYFVPNSYNGKFVFVGNRGSEYNIIVAADGKVVFIEDYKIPDDAPNQMSYKSIRLDIDNKSCFPDVKQFEKNGIDPENVDADGKVYDMNLKIKNLLFGFNQTQFTKEDDANLDALIFYLKTNPSAVIEIGAYADSKGKAVMNQLLSEKRGNTLKAYIVSKGVLVKQLVVVGYGEENPIALNLINGVYNENSQKFNRRVEFRILQHGEKTLLIRPIDNIPTEYKNPDYKSKYVKSEKNDVESLK